MEKEERWRLLWRSGAEAGDGEMAMWSLGLYSLGRERCRTGGQKGGGGELTWWRRAWSSGQKGGTARTEVGGIRGVQARGAYGCDGQRAM
ncbi:hypothetical protein E2562_037228 [Oryza meyeriana var. granulata]|uniref:Uncharacterized protein n=1 Tax=Oryza meyeriana var. granulata TaxID=110450 RepID=A0A6G1ETR2_9ORYZ|nr:hypothetical protein E2562_037227 [Oryza meyeriana var. granulata]KAF0928014.1 hypothetical protein E2562_037228 [Oryza meyeriana var. granulata]